MMEAMRTARMIAAVLATMGGGCHAASASSAPTSSPETPPPPADEPTAAPPIDVRLAGAVHAPGGIDLQFFAELHRDAAGATQGRLDIPMQGAHGVELADVQITDARLAFSLAGVGATWTAEIADDGTLQCAFEQRGIRMPCDMRTLDAPAFAAAKAPPARPQMPKPPFPYEALPVEYDGPAGVHLAGTLTVPAGEGPHPAVLLVSGSGAQDRDETIAGHKPFWVIADHLSRHGIAVLRVDDRGVGGSTGAQPTDTTADFAKDAEAGVAFLQSQPGIDPRRVGVLGHSEGGAIAPLVAASRKDLAFIVMMAGPGVDGGEVLVAQVAALAKAAGATEAQIEASRAAQARIVDAIRTEDDPAALEATLRSMLPPGPAVDGQISTLLSPWYRYFIRFDPRPTLRKVRCPVLILNGELDTQVVAEQNVPAIEAALRKGGNRHVTTHRLDGLNHLMQPAKTGGVAEYEQIEQTIAPEVLRIVAEFITAQPPVKKRR
jgi:pimeloyl-ACP methyl ester carboxylesterase